MQTYKYLYFSYEHYYYHQWIHDQRVTEYNKKLIAIILIKKPHT